MAQKATSKKPAAKPAKKTAVASKPAPKKPAPAPAPAKKAETKPVEKAPEKGGKKSVPAKAPEPVKEVKKEKVPQLSKSDLQYYRNLLLERRREIIGDVGTMENEAFKAGSNLSNMPIHMADVGTDNFEQEFTLGLIESERQTLREIQEALVRIDNGTYGICENCGNPIGKARLQVFPRATLCMTCKQREERR